MANYATLIAAIQSVITQNGNNEITGPILQQTLISVVNSLGSGYQFIGVATPSTTPGTPDQRVFYIGSAGTYPNFGPAVVPDGNMGIFYYDSGWHFGTVAFPIGSGTITETNLASSLVNKLFATGYKFSGIATPSTTPGTPDQCVFYIGGPGTYQNFGEQRIVNEGQLGFFKYNTNWTFETVQVGETNTVKYIVQTLTNAQKAQARTNIDAASNEQVSQLEALFSPSVINGNAYSINTSLNGTTNRWETISGTVVKSKLVAILPGYTYRIFAENGYAIYAVLTTDAHANGTFASYATGFSGRRTLTQGNTVNIVIPSDSDARYLNFRADNVSGNPYEPSIVRQGGFVSKSDVVDNLNSTSPEDVLSANQGRILKEAIGDVAYNVPVDLDNEITLNDFWVGRGAYPSSWYKLAGYKTKVIAVPDGTKKVTIVTGYTGTYRPTVPVFFMASYTTPTADLDPVDFAEGYTRRVLLNSPATTTIDVPEDCTYIAIGYYDIAAEIYYNFQVTFVVRSTVSELLAEMEQEISDLRSTVLAGADVTYFDNFQISPMLTNDKSRPLVYEGDTKSSGNFLCNAVAYPNGTIIAARSGVGVVKIDDNGETTILSLPGSTDMRCLWMDEDLTVYASPFNGADADGAATNIGNGLYRKPYGTDTFTKVLNLSAGNTIWTMCRDRGGYIYCGEYSIVNNVPVIYRSSDNGLTWASVINFNSAGLTSHGRHIHSVIYNKYNDKLYAIVGEVNTIFRSGDKGSTWSNLNVQFYDKGSSMFATPHGILVGSDSAYWCDLDLLLPDDSSHKKVSRIWADTVFGIRQSDQTGFLYAFCKIDSSVKSSSYMPQIDLSDDAAVAAYIASHTSGAWRNYYDSMKDYYPDDAMRPTHFAILISRDEGKTWEVLYAGETGAINADGIWTIGYFRNGECLCGHIRSTSSSSRNFVNPIIISEGRHKYQNGKISVEGDIFAKTLSSTNIDAL